MIIEKKRKTAAESVDSMKIFVPDFFPGEHKDPPRYEAGQAEQFPPVGTEPSVSVGIMHDAEIRFVLHGEFLSHAIEGKKFSGEYAVSITDDGKLLFGGERYDVLDFYPARRRTDIYFTLKDVAIGIGFHWERHENQSFAGQLRFIPDGSEAVAINDIGVEEYLTSVISSEMSAKAEPELLKAHAVISRSWLLKPMLDPEGEPVSPICEKQSDNEIIRWYERDAHELFDVCADDHCQRYQGITRVGTTGVRLAVEATRGMVLTYGRHICDARFSKACGGVSELFENCWADHHYDYLTPVADSAAWGEMPDLTDEATATQWIMGAPEAFCNTHDSGILGQILNDYDRETADFYRWTVEYTRGELSELVRRKSGIDLGEITDLIPMERGTSGRIVRLKIVGSRRTVVVGKELEIRKWLSESHLYSSAFVVEKTDAGFKLTGAGWGHGVGLCQIGAAVMADKGYDYQAILHHYFRGAKIENLYS